MQRYILSLHQKRGKPLNLRGVFPLSSNRAIGSLACSASKHLVNELFKLLVGKSVLKLAE